MLLLRHFPHVPNAKKDMKFQLCPYLSQQLTKKNPTFFLYASPLTTPSSSPQPQPLFSHLFLCLMFFFLLSPLLLHILLLLDLLFWTLNLQSQIHHRIPQTAAYQTATNQMDLLEIHLHGLLIMMGYQHEWWLGTPFEGVYFLVIVILVCILCWKKLKV